MTRLLTPQMFVAAALLAAGCCEPLPPRRPRPPEPPPLPEADAEPAEAPPPAPVLVLLPSDSSNSVSFRFVFASGSADDPAYRPGLTRLAAELMADGGTETLTYPELARALFPMAAEISVHVDRDQTVFFGRAHKDEAGRYYELLRDVLVRPRMAGEDFSRIRDRSVTAPIKTLRGNDDEDPGNAALAWKLWAGHPYAHPTLGTRTSLEAATLDEVREQRARTMCASRLTVGIAGAFDDALVERVEEDMAGLPAGCEARPEAPAREARSGRQAILVDKPTAEAVAVSIGFDIDVRRGDADYAALKLVEAWFGQHRTFSGRLQKVLRVDRGFNYGNYSYAEHFEQLGWTRVPMTNVARREQHFSIWLRPVKPAQAHFAIRLAIDELERLVKGGLSAEDVERTRTFMKRYYLTFAQTEEQRLGYAIDDSFYGSKRPFFEELFGALDSLTADAVNEAIAAHLSFEDLTIAAVVPNAEAFAAARAADEPSPISYDSPKPAAITDRDAAVAVKKLGIEAGSIEIVPVGGIFE